MVKEILDNIDLNGVKGLLIDLDNTLYPYLSNHLRSMDKCREKCKTTYGISNEDFDKFFRPSREKINNQLHGQAASHSRLLYFQIFSEISKGYTNPSFALEMEELYWSEFMSGMEFIPGVEDFLKRVKSMGIKSCIITDLTTQIQLRKWQKLDLGRYINFMLSSEEAGIEKPERKIFELALEKLSMNAQEVIMIGDNEDKDILGAEALGIKSYLVNID